MRRGLHGLTEKQAIFCEEYLTDFNATRAYLAAYPRIKSETTAASCGARMLRNAKVVDYLHVRMEEREKRTQITQDRVLLELARIAFANTTDFAQVVEQIDTDADTGQELRRYQGIELTLTERLSPDQRAALAEIKSGRDGPSIKLHDKVKALELIGKHLAMFTDRVEQVGEQVVSIKLPDQFQPEEEGSE